jgi:hypothetical protein
MRRASPDEPKSADERSREADDSTAREETTVTHRAATAATDARKWAATVRGETRVAIPHEVRETKRVVVAPNRQKPKADSRSEYRSRPFRLRAAEVHRH